MTHVVRREAKWSKKQTRLEPTFPETIAAVHIALRANDYRSYLYGVNRREIMDSRSSCPTGYGSTCNSNLIHYYIGNINFDIELLLEDNELEFAYLNLQNETTKK